MRGARANRNATAARPRRAERTATPHPRRSSSAGRRRSAATPPLAEVEPDRASGDRRAIDERRIPVAADRAERLFSMRTVTSASAAPRTKNGASPRGPRRTDRPLFHHSSSTGRRQRPRPSSRAARQEQHQRERPRRAARAPLGREARAPAVPQRGGAVTSDPREALGTRASGRGALRQRVLALGRPRHRLDVTGCTANAAAPTGIALAPTARAARSHSSTTLVACSRRSPGGIEGRRTADLVVEPERGEGQQVVLRDGTGLEPDARRPGEQLQRRVP